MNNNNKWKNKMKRNMKKNKMQEQENIKKFEEKQIESLAK